MNCCERSNPFHDRGFVLLMTVITLPHDCLHNSSLLSLLCLKIVFTILHDCHYFASRLSPWFLMVVVTAFMIIIYLSRLLFISHDCGLSLMTVVYLSWLWFISHDCGLSLTTVVYLSWLWFISHDCCLSLKTVVYLSWLLFISQDCCWSLMTVVCLSRLLFISHDCGLLLRIFVAHGILYSSYCARGETNNEGTICCYCTWQRRQCWITAWVHLHRTRLHACEVGIFWEKYHNSQNRPTTLIEEALKKSLNGCILWLYV